MELFIGAAAACITVGIRNNMNRKNREAEHKMAQARCKDYEAKCKMDKAAEKVRRAELRIEEAERAMHAVDIKEDLHSNIKNLKKRLEMDDTELKLRRRQMELYEKRMELFRAIDTRQLEYCMIVLENGVVPPHLEWNGEVEENEYKMDGEIRKELSEISHELEDVKRG